MKRCEAGRISAELFHGETCESFGSRLAAQPTPDEFADNLEVFFNTPSSTLATGSPIWIIGVGLEKTSHQVSRFSVWQAVSRNGVSESLYAFDVLLLTRTFAACTLHVSPPPHGAQSAVTSAVAGDGAAHLPAAHAAPGACPTTHDSPPRGSSRRELA